MAAWTWDGLRMRVAINLSAYQLRESGLADRIREALQRHGVPASHLLCEITESVAMEDTRATQRAIEELGRIGVYLSIDDFGTGYSSLHYLRSLPARQLKIDRSFVRDLEEQEAPVPSWMRWCGWRTPLGRSCGCAPTWARWTKALADWWQEFQLADEARREDMIDQVREEQKQRQRKNQPVVRRVPKPRRRKARLPMMMHLRHSPMPMAPKAIPAMAVP